MEKLNPFLKGTTILLCGLILSFSYSILLNGSVIIACLLLLLFFSKAKVSSVIKIMLPAFLAAASIFYTGLLYTDSSMIQTEELSKISSLNFEVLSYSVTSVYNALQLSTRVLAFACLGILFALTTDGEEFVMSLMHQCRLSPKYAYGVLAAFHLLPNIKEELQKTKLAFKVRGIPVHWYSVKPVFAMLVNTIRWSESVAMAMEAKGFDGEGRRSYYTVTYLYWFDWCFFVGMVLLVLTGTIFLRL